MIKAARRMGMVALVAVMTLATSDPARGQGLDVGVDFVSDYVFRGVDRGEGVSLQPYATYTVSDFYASLWVNLTLEGNVALSETDYNLGYRFDDTKLPLTLDFGWILYDVADVGETQELYAGVHFDDAPLRPSLYLFYDFTENPGLFYRLAARRTVELPRNLGAVDIAAALGFQTGRDPEGFQYGLLSVGFQRRLGDWTINPALDMYFPRDRITPRDVNGFQPVFRFSVGRAF